MPVENLCMSITFIVLLVTAVSFDFLNGFHDSSNIVATPIASRAMRPRLVLWLAALMEFLGPFLFGVAVAETIATGLTDPANITMQVVIAAMLSAVAWNIITWWVGIPSSSSHALIGGLVGAIIISAGIEAIEAPGLIKVGTALFLSPVLGIIVGYLLMNLTLFLARGATPKVNGFFRQSQIFTTAGLALSHGANDAQKTMGIITLGLMVEGSIDEFVVPTWVIAVSAGAIALGTAMGGWRLIKTLGYRIYKVRPVHGFVSQISGASIILGAAMWGAPVSTTQVMSSSIMGAGSAERLSKVRWLVGYEMVVAWLLTIPFSAVLSVIFYYLLGILGVK
jgi:PiT family inorganic phosphate transporter